jgi:hypothetical protein
VIDRRIQSARINSMANGDVKKTSREGPSGAPMVIRLRGTGGFMRAYHHLLSQKMEGA